MTMHGPQNVKAVFTS